MAIWLAVKLKFGNENRLRALRANLGACLFAWNKSFLWRALLAAVFVVLAHLFSWDWLKFVTSQIILQLSHILGASATRISLDTISMNREVFRFVTACTFIDVFVGAVPLIWNLRESALRNLIKMGAVACALFAFNIIRLAIGQLLFIHGVSWILAHEVVGGLSYFNAVDVDLATTKLGEDSKQQLPFR